MDNWPQLVQHKEHALQPGRKCLTGATDAAVAPELHLTQEPMQQGRMCLVGM